MTDTAPLVLVAHGTRRASGVAAVAALAETVREHIDRVHVAYVDVLGPTPSEVLATVDPGPVVVVPAFLASGYHVHQDVPREVAASGRENVVITDALGPSPALAEVMADAVRNAGLRDGDTVILAAAGSSDSRAVADVETAAAQLGEALGHRVEVAFIATGAVRVPCVVAAQRIRNLTRPGSRVVVASYLLAPGLFHDRLARCGADAVTDPLGVDPAVVQLLVERYRTALSSLQ